MNRRAEIRSGLLPVDRGSFEYSYLVGTENVGRDRDEFVSIVGVLGEFSKVYGTRTPLRSELLTEIEGSSS